MQKISLGQDNYIRIDAAANLHCPTLPSMKVVEQLLSSPLEPICLDTSVSDHSIAPSTEQKLPSKSKRESTSKFWKRVDVREKKIIRGLTSLARDYFKDKVDLNQNIDEILSVWASTLKSDFSTLIQEPHLLSIISQLMVNMFAWRYRQHINSITIYSNEDKARLLAEADEYRKIKNSGANVAHRQALKKSTLVQIGKSLYNTDVRARDEFWNRLSDRKRKNNTLQPVLIEMIENDIAQI